MQPPILHSHYDGVSICNQVTSLEKSDISRSFRMQSRLQTGAP